LAFTTAANLLLQRRIGLPLGAFRRSTGRGRFLALAAPSLVLALAFFVPPFLQMPFSVPVSLKLVYALVKESPQALG